MVTVIIVIVIMNDQAIAPGVKSGASDIELTFSLLRSRQEEATTAAASQLSYRDAGRCGCTVPAIQCARTCSSKVSNVDRRPATRWYSRDPT